MGKWFFMYLHLGGSCVVRFENVIGIFDIEKTTSDPITKNYLNKAGKAGEVIYPTNDLPRSFVVTSENNKAKYNKCNKDKQKIYLSQFTTNKLTMNDVQ